MTSQNDKATNIIFIKKRIAELEPLVSTSEKIKILELRNRVEELGSLPQEFNAKFSLRGWIAYDSLDVFVISNALKLMKEKNIEKAEAYLIEYYHSDVIRLSISTLWGVEMFRDRLHLIKLAYDDYICGRYHSCVPLLLMMIDGVFADANNNVGFFSEKSDVTSWDTIVGDNSGLQTIKSIFFKMRGTTTKSKITLPYRNGIMHGRDLGYANKEVSAKCWALLFAVRDQLLLKKNEKDRVIKYNTDSQKNVYEIQKELRMLEDQLYEVTIMDSFKRSPVLVGVDHPIEGVSTEYPLKTPERCVVEFIELWKVRNYGKMASYIYRPNYVTLGQMKGRMSKTFKDKEIEGFAFIQSTDVSSCVVESVVKLLISHNDKIAIEHEITFRLLHCELDSSELVVEPKKDGMWKIVDDFIDIREIGTNLEWL